MSFHPPPPPHLVLLPGLDGTGTLFAPLIEALGAEVRTTVLSYPPDPTLGYPALVRLARSRLPDTAGQPFWLLGESFSGPIAMALAAQGLTGLAGLVLCCTFARNPRPAWSRWRALLHALPPPGLLGARATTLIARRLLGPHADPALGPLLAQVLERLPAAVVRRRLAAVIEVDASQALASLDLPILSMRASQDAWVPASASALIQQLQPRVRTVCLPGPHFLLQANAPLAAQTLREFIRPPRHGDRARMPPDGPAG